MAQTTITIDLADRDALKRYKLSVAGDAGRDIPMGKLIGILVEIGKRHHAEVITLAQER
jgi:hypothetical protein